MQKQESFYTKLHDVLTWKRVVAFNVLLLLVFVVPMSVRLAQRNTETRSSAAVETSPSPEPPVNYPAGDPGIERVLMFYGKPGDTVALLGENFGDYQWESEVYLGNAKVKEEDIVRWSNEIIEAEIPNQARTGQVWVEVNNKRASWSGSLFLYNVNRSTKVGLEKAEETGYFWAGKAGEIAKGTVELGWNAGNLSVSGQNSVNIENQSTSADDFGNKMVISFRIENDLSRARTRLIELNKQVGQIELLQVEMYDAQGGLISVYAEPQGSKISF